MINDSTCSMTFDCTLNTKTRRKIEARINDNGTSFQDCQENCNAIFEDSGTKSKTRTDPTRTKRQTRTITRDKSRTISVTKLSLLLSHGVAVLARMLEIVTATALCFIILALHLSQVLYYMQ